MKRVIAIGLIVGSGATVAGFQSGATQAGPSQQVQQQLIALDKQWGEAGSKGDMAALEKIVADGVLAIGPNGEAQGKKEQLAPPPTGTGGTYKADEYQFESLSPDIIVMMHRGTTTGTEGGKAVTESHRSLHVFQRRSGTWQVVANAQIPITKP
jgi:ketosteroid isomerase-like protein